MITTDYYDVCETAVITLLQNTVEFGWKKKELQVTKSDDTNLDGGFDNFAITYPGAFPNGFAGGDVVQVRWEILIDMIVRWKASEKQVWKDFKAHRSLMFNLFNLSYEGKTINRTPGIVDVSFESRDRPRYIPLNRDPQASIISHIGQIGVLTITQNIDKEK